MNLITILYKVSAAIVMLVMYPWIIFMLICGKREEVIEFIRKIWW